MDPYCCTRTSSAVKTVLVPPAQAAARPGDRAGCGLPDPTPRGTGIDEVVGPEAIVNRDVVARRAGEELVHERRQLRRGRRRRRRRRRAVRARRRPASHQRHHQEHPRAFHARAPPRARRSRIGVLTTDHRAPRTRGQREAAHAGLERSFRALGDLPPPQDRVVRRDRVRDIADDATWTIAQEFTQHRAESPARSCNMNECESTSCRMHDSAFAHCELSCMSCGTHSTIVTHHAYRVASSVGSRTGRSHLALLPLVLRFPPQSRSIAARRCETTGTVPLVVDASRRYPHAPSCLTPTFPPHRVARGRPRAGGRRVVGGRSESACGRELRRRRAGRSLSAFRGRRRRSQSRALPRVDCTSCARPATTSHSTGRSTRRHSRTASSSSSTSRSPISSRTVAPPRSSASGRASARCRSTRTTR